MYNIMYHSRYYIVLLMYTLYKKKYIITINYNIIFQQTMRRRRGRYGEKTFLIFLRGNIKGQNEKITSKKATTSRFSLRFYVIYVYIIYLYI